MESIKTNNYFLNPRMNLYNMRKIRIKFTGRFLNKFPPAILHRNIVNIYIIYEITSNYSDINYPGLENCLFRSIKLTKNADIDIHKDIFACLFSIHNTISLSRHEQVCLSGLRFERYFSHHRAT